VERNRIGQWVLSKPVSAPADGSKVESLLAMLTSLRVMDGPKGFVADDVDDLARYGLDKPEITVELETAEPQAGRKVLHLGHAVPDNDERVYARTGDENDVVLVNAALVRELPNHAVDLRSQRVADIDPAAVSEIQIVSKPLGADFVLKRTPTGWMSSRPHEEKAEDARVLALIQAVQSLETADFLSEGDVTDPRVSPPQTTLKIWQDSEGQGRRPTATGDAGDSAGENRAERRPALSLEIGRHDAIKKTVYARLEGDSALLLLPDSFVSVLPQNSASFRDRSVTRLDPSRVDRLSIQRRGQTYTVVPDESGGAAHQWKMIEPVEARGDVASITQILSALSDLRAVDFIADVNQAELSRYGLDQPSLEISWTTVENGSTRSASNLPAENNATKAANSLSPDADGSASGTRTGATQRLVIGSQVPRDTHFYAKLDGFPLVFTIGQSTLSLFEAELHDRLVLSFPASKARTIVFHREGQTLSLSRTNRPAGTPGDWIDESGLPMTGFDMTVVSPLVSHLGQLRTNRFIQYRGVIPKVAGLEPPRLQVEVTVRDDPSPKILRIGATRNDGTVFAALGTGSSGPVFDLPAEAWNGLIESLGRLGRLPDDVFSPAEGAERGH
jgi:hypothetical protein